MIERHAETESVIAEALRALGPRGRVVTVADAIRGASFLRLADNIEGGDHAPADAIAYLERMNPGAGGSPHDVRDIARLAFAAAWVHAWATVETA